MLVFPIMNYSLRVNVDELLFPKGPVLSTETFMGTTTVMCIMFIFPSTIILRDVHKICTKQDRVLAVLVIMFAVGTSVTAIYSNVHQTFLSSSNLIS
ncbi:unnamed protein product [Cuscuta campestris]|uniref:Amino acid transporter transmembrane domain-containing protein n=1 Tax=Cuscuta campestris TaxID=132261 RepID=A0A484L1M0_9ASTE|nr:unnamed protein product [Cuscuta campestris]